MKISFPSRPLLHLSLCAGALLSACYGDVAPETNDDANDGSVADTTQDLFVGKTSYLWSSADPIPVCFQPSSAVWNNPVQKAAYTALKATVRGWVESEYEGLPNIDIDFTGWSDCPNYAQFAEQDEGSDKIEISVVDAGGGAQTLTNNIFRIGLATSKNWVNHEMLHALGFHDHEHQRSDAPASVGKWSTEYNVGKLQCTADDINYHLNDDGTLGKPACDPSFYHQDTPGIYLTKYDFWSIGNAAGYCHCRDGLSDLDKLGLEMSYPTSLTKSPVHTDYAFRTGSHSVVAFSNLVLHNDWFSRGAIAPAFGDGTVQWKTGPSYTGGVSDSGAGWARGTSGTYRCDWTDYLGRSRRSEQLVVDVSAPRAAAVLMSVI